MRVKDLSVDDELNIVLLDLVLDPVRDNRLYSPKVHLTDDLLLSPSKLDLSERLLFLLLVDEHVGRFAPISSLSTVDILFIGCVRGRFTAKRVSWKLVVSICVNMLIIDISNANRGCNMNGAKNSNYVVIRMAGP